MTKEFLSSTFIILCIGVALIYMYPILFIPKGVLELVINQNHFPSLDIFFKYFTHLGDGSLLVVLLIIFLFVKYSLAIVTSFSIVLQSVLVSIFKRWIFEGSERPLAFFGDDVELNFVEGVDVHTSNTFPSGHTATGFAIFALLFIVVKKRRHILSIVLFLSAFLVGMSRVYLLQHFIVDVYFGAIFGILSVLLSLYLAEILFTKRQWEMLEQKSLKTKLLKKIKDVQTTP